MTESNPKIRRLGYARVSTYGQTLDAQLAQLRADGCARIYREKASGAQPTRRELLRLLKALAPGDVVTVTRIDRLARSTFDLFAIVKPVTGRTVGRHRHQHRAADDRRPRRAGGRRARPDPHPHGGRTEPGEGARAAHGPSPEAHAGAAG
jgi:DNA invertase Pin-like site-specific DNA recombinase